MKKLFVIMVIFILSYSSIFSQVDLFEKIEQNRLLSKNVIEKIEHYKKRSETKKWEYGLLKNNMSYTIGHKAILNIFGNKLELEITKDFGEQIGGVHGYKAIILEGGYAILSVSQDEVNLIIWYKNNCYTIEAVGDKVYLFSEINVTELAKLNAMIV